MPQSVMIGGSVIEGYVTEVTSPGENFDVYLNPGVWHTTGSWGNAPEVVTPYAAFDDFALFGLADPDPAQTYAGWNTAGMQTGQTGYSRPWGIFYPPLDYYTSDGLLWPRAAYMALGFQFGNVPAGVQQNLTGAQAELMPLAGTNSLDQTPGPSGYDLPRSVKVLVKPNRLNYATNPNFQAGAGGWTTQGGATISSTGVATFPNAGSSVRLWVPWLITGDDFTASLYAAIPSGLSDVKLTVGSQTGGVPGATSVDQAAGTVRPQLTFTAPSRDIYLNVSPVLGDGTFPVTMTLSQVLIEAGQIVGEYFDGSYGNPDYGWESAGTPGLTRSYYYENFKPGEVVVNDIVTRQVPLSISAADPEFFTSPTQLGVACGVALV